MAQVCSWSVPGIGPLGGLIVLAVLYRLLRQLRQRHEPRSRSPLMAPEGLWTLVAGCSYFAGMFGAVMAYNPDGYMQPGPSGAPWWLIISGSVVGAVVGSVAAGILWSLNAALGAQHRR